MDVYRSGIKLSYVSGWPQAFVHCRKDDEKEWTQLPGLPFKKVGGTVWTAQVDASKLEFVCTDGKGDWDKTPSKANYLIHSPGSYEVVCGHINKAAETDEHPAIEAKGEKKEAGDIARASNKQDVAAAVKEEQQQKFTAATDDQKQKAAEDSAAAARAPAAEATAAEGANAAKQEKVSAAAKDQDEQKKEAAASPGNRKQDTAAQKEQKKKKAAASKNQKQETSQPAEAQKEVSAVKSSQASEKDAAQQLLATPESKGVRPIEDKKQEAATAPKEEQQKSAVTPAPKEEKQEAAVAPAQKEQKQEAPAGAQMDQQPVQSSASMFRQKSLTILGPMADGKLPRNPSRSNSLSRLPQVNLIYHSGWAAPYLHCCQDGEAWTTLPGIPWEKKGDGVWSLQLNTSKVEFVCTDGKGGWDKPRGGGNYSVTLPGEYIVRSGTVKRSLPPPRKPQLIVIDGIGPSSLKLAWNPPDEEDGLAGYRIYGMTEAFPTPDPKSLVGQTNGDIRSYTVTGLKGSRKYTFLVTTVNEDGIESDCVSVEGTTTQPGRPSAPTFLQVTSHGVDHVALSWQPPQDIGGASVTAYHVFRDGKAVDTVVSRNTETGEDLKLITWQDKHVETGKAYKYAVAAMHLPNRTPSRSDLVSILEKRASKSLLEVQPEDNEGPPCEEVEATAVAALRMPKLGEQTTHVILQGFNWWSCDNKSGWYNVLLGKVQDFKDAGFDMIWLPPPAQCADRRGYLPSKWYDLNSYYGKQDELVALGQALSNAGICPMMDLVINHRCASKQDNRGKWTIYEEPAWGAWAICNNDQSGAGEGNASTGELLEYAPDIDHTNQKVQQDVKEWIAWMFKTVGIRALRLDFVIGFAPHLQEMYVRAAGSPFTVAEYWHGDPNVLRNYVNATKGQIAVFDFPVYYTLKNCIRSDDYGGLSWDGKPPGIMGSDPVRSCTFVENHDTDHLEIVGGPFGNNEQIVRGYVYILTHPGTPTVFWSDWSDRGQDVQKQITRCVQIRNEKGLHCVSKCSIAVAEGGLYAAYIDGTRGGVAVKLGHRGWSPNGQCWSVAASGNGYCVWVRK